MYMPVFSDLNKSPIVGKVAILKPDAKVRFKMKFFPDVQFDQRCPVPKHVSALWLLQDTHRQVSHVVKSLAEYL